MQSRSHLLIEKELLKVEQAKLWGITVSLLDENIYDWCAKIRGPKGTLWEGGIFQVYLKFDEHYNAKPPKIRFHTIPYHPNIDMISGAPCIDFLDDVAKWKSNYKICMLLLQIQNMLGNPVLDNAINPEAVNLMIDSPQSYQKIVSECVHASQKLAEGNVELLDAKKYSLPAMIEKVEDHTESRAEILLTVKKTTKLSFDDYFSQWNGIATTKCKPENINPYVETLKSDEVQRKVHYGMNDAELEEEDLNKQEEYDSLYYGSLHEEKKKATKEPSKREAKLARINQMKKIYLPKKPLSTPRSPIPPYHNNDPELKEVDDLVAWTKNLNPEDID